MKLTWYDGDKAAEPGLPPGYNIPAGDMGVLFIGKEGMLRADYGSRTLYPEKKFKGFKPPQPTIPNSIGHHKEFFEACKAGGPTTCNFHYAGAPDRGGVAGGRSVPGGKEVGVGRHSAEGHELPRGRFLLPRLLPERVDAVEEGKEEPRLEKRENPPFGISQTHPQMQFTRFSWLPLLNRGHFLPSCVCQICLIC